jgi:formiminoglutamase
MSKYQAPMASLWTGRASAAPLYWHQHVECFDIASYQKDTDHQVFGILGYQGDEGVIRNQGRAGAVGGPAAIRQLLGAMSWHLLANSRVIDFGDVICEGGALEQTHGLISASVSSLMSKGVFPIVLGGGHDLAYAHFNGIKKTIGAKKRIGILNLDAHFDLRKVEEKRTSGTPFYQIIEENTQVEYCCLGIQKPSNSAALFEYANQREIDFLLAEDYTILHWKQVENSLERFSDKVDHIYLTIDLDGFSSAYAPGVSAPSPMGFNPDIVVKTIQWVKQTSKVRSADIVELNPRFDVNQCTARLAARLIEVLTN